MRGLRYCGAVVALAGLAFPLPSRALLLPVVEQLHETASHLRSGQVYSVDLATPIAVAPGDTLDLTLTFGKGTMLRLDDFQLLGVFLAPADGLDAATLESSDTLEFLGAGGLLINPTAPRSRTSGAGELGGPYGATDFASGPGPFAFSGLRLRSGLIAEVGAGRPATVGRVAFWFTGTNLDAVPEPASWTLMITGFGLAGVALRRQTTSMKLSSTRF